MTGAKPFPDGIAAKREWLDTDSYRDLFRHIGAPWLWSSRLVMPNDDLATILAKDTTETWIVRSGDSAIGLVELDFQVGGECELAYFGLIKYLTGRGVGGPMMALAQEMAFAHDITRFYVHTCNWDDPRALAFYQRAGFTPYKMRVEVFPDPRLDGIHPMNTAGHVPCLT
jgi:ribosomal protein S18 acetylase RimI-like enzyme